MKTAEWMKEMIPLLPKTRGNIVLQSQDSEERRATGSSWYASVFLFVNTILGAGLLNFPYAYKLAGGVAVSIGMQVISLFFIIVTTFILAFCSDISHTHTYQDVIFAFLGRKTQRLCALTLFVLCYGICITYLVIIGDQWEEFFLFVSKTKYCDENPWYMGRPTTIVVTSTILILPMCFPRRIDFLKYSSAVGVVGAIYVATMVTVKYFLPHDPAGLIRTAPEQWMDIFSVLPVIIFSYEANISVVPIYSCLAKRDLKELAKTILIALFICMVIYTCTSSFGYLTFGNDITSDLLLSYKAEPEIIAAITLIGIKTYTTYPILLFIGRQGLDSVIIDIVHSTSESAKNREQLRRIIITIVWFASTLVFAVYVPNMSVVIQPLGATSAIFTFVFPGLCLLRLILQRVDFNCYWSKLDKFLVLTGVFIITLGIFLFVVTLTKAIMDDASESIKADRSRYTCT